MTREIRAQPPSEDALREDLRSFLERLSSAGITDVEAQFGFAWGNFRYPGQWQFETMSTSALLAEIAATEERGDGTLGTDDLYIRVPALKCERCYCHHGDVHLTCEMTDFFDAEQQRWRDSGWELRVWDRSGDAHTNI